MDLNKFFYEFKPLIMILVGVLALLQINQNPWLYGLSGALLICAGSWILGVRLKFRGYFKSVTKTPQSDSQKD